MFLSKSLWLVVLAWCGWCGWRGDEDKVPALSGWRAVLATSWPLARMPCAGGGSLPRAREQQSSFCNIGRLGPFPTLAWLRGKGKGWVGCKVQGGGLRGLRGCLCREVREPTGTFLCLQRFPRLWVRLAAKIPW